MRTLILLCATIFCAASYHCTGPEEASDPNFILLMGDDHGWDETGYQGHPYVKTPVLDEMAANGLRLDRFYSAHPSCSPTRGSVMTGRHPNRYGTFAPNWSMRPEEISIAHLLSKAGYTAAHFGKWHLGPVKKDSPTSPGAMGFDEWLSHDNFFELNPVLSRNGEPPQQIEGEGSEVLIDEAIRFIEQSRNAAQPYFIIIWFGSPHEPYSGLPEDLALYDNLPASLDTQMVRLTSNETGQPVNRPLRAVLQERYAEITAMDRAIGKLRSFLKEEEMQNNTLLWYCGDNGTPASAGRTGMTLRGEKGNMYEGGIRVPGVIEWPGGIPHPGISEFLSVTSDMLPTLCELTGQALPDRPLDGTSLVPLLADPALRRTQPVCFWSFQPDRAFDASARDYIDPVLQEGTTPLVKMMDGKYTRTFRNYHYPEVSDDHLGGERTIITQQYKLVIEGRLSEGGKIELFDLEKDAAEQHNLAEDLPAIADQLQAEMIAWQRSVLESLTGADYP